MTLSKLIPVLILFGVLGGCGGGGGGGGAPAPVDPIDSGGNDDDDDDDSSGLFPTCTSPASLTAAMEALNESRPCWEWIDEQATSLPRQNDGEIFKTFYFDPSRFGVGDPEPSDHTEETVAYQNTLLEDYPWINAASLPPVAPPWATVEGDIRFPFSEEEFDEKLRGIATQMLYARSLGLSVRISLMMQDEWNEALDVANVDEFNALMEDTYVPQITQFATMAERINAEYLSAFLEVDKIAESSQTIRRLPADEQLALLQYHSDQVAEAVNAVFTGTNLGSVTVLYLTEEQARAAPEDGGIDVQMNVPDWTQLTFAGYDQIGITISVNCTPGGNEASSRITQAEMLQRLTGYRDSNPGKPWSILEIQPPYEICGDDRLESFQNFTALIDAYPVAPLGVGMGIAPISDPDTNVDDASLAWMSDWLATK